MFSNAAIMNIAVLTVVSQADLGLRPETLWRVLRPLLLAAIIVSLSIKRPTGHGAGLAFEPGLAAPGVALGLFATTRLKRVGKHQRTGAIMMTLTRVAR